MATHARVRSHVSVVVLALSDHRSPLTCGTYAGTVIETKHPSKFCLMPCHVSEIRPKSRPPSQLSTRAVFEMCLPSAAARTTRTCCRHPGTECFPTSKVLKGGTLIESHRYTHLHSKSRVIPTFHAGIAIVASSILRQLLLSSSIKKIIFQSCSNCSSICS